MAGAASETAETRAASDATIAGVSLATGWVGRSIVGQKIVKATTGIAARVPSLGPAIAIAVAIVAVSMVDGGYGGVALGSVTVAIWAAIVLLSLFGDPERSLPAHFLVAAGALAVLAVLAALSLGWSPDPGAGFTDVVRLSAYLGVFVLAGILLRPGTGRGLLAGVAGGLVVVSAIALASRLLGVGGGDEALVASFPSSAGRLSYPIGYWNGLGAMAAMAVPVLVWLGAAVRRPATGLIAACFVPVLLANYMTSSRGGLIAAALGAGIAIAADSDRARSFAVLLVGVIASVPAVAAAALANGILDAPWSGTGGPEVTVCVTLALGLLFAVAAGPAIIDRLGVVRVPGLRVRHVVAAALVVLAVLVVIVGPGEVAGDFAAKEGRQSTGSGGATLSVSGSGRAQFWGAALDAFAAEPANGIGAGGYETWWNRKGTLETPAQNAHSEPLELLAELGPVGLLAFLTFFGVVGFAGVRRARQARGAAAGAAVGLLATAAVGLLIDWTWDLPAVMLPVLCVAALLCSRGLDAPGGPVAATERGLDRLVSIPAPALALIAIVFAVPIAWAGGVLAVATDRLEASDDALASGQLNDAAQAARSAASVEPWSAAPWLQLATIEQAAGNVDASRRAVAEAIDRSPDDFRGWLLASDLEAQLGNDGATDAYAIKAVGLAPLVLPRVAIEPRSG